MKKCVDYYKKEADFVDFSEKYFPNTTYGEKLRNTLISKFPRDPNESLWGFIRELLGYSGEEKESLLSIPSVSKNSQLMSNLSAAASMNPNLLLTSDIANVLFNSGKFPSATSLLGLPDPMAQSTLAANNMFLQTNLFKMQDLLKPVSTSSPIPGKSKLEKAHSLKIPNDLKNSKIDYADINLLSLKNKIDYTELTQNIKQTSKIDYLSDLSASMNKISKEFAASDLSASMSRLSSDLIKSNKTDGSLDFSLSESAERPLKVPKTEFSTLDLSLPSSKSFNDTYANYSSNSTVEELSKTTNSNVSNEPMNLTSE